MTPQNETHPVQVMALHNRNTSSQITKDSPIDVPHDGDEAREASLRQELAGIRSINEVVEGVIESLERAKGNIVVSLG